MPSNKTNAVITAHITTSRPLDRFHAEVLIVDETGERYRYQGYIDDEGQHGDSLDCWLSDGLVSMLAEPRWAAHTALTAGIVQALGCPDPEGDETVTVEI